MTNLSLVEGSGRRGIAHAVLAIGKPTFASALLEGLRNTAGVGHCMVFTFNGENSARCRLGIGNISIGPDLGTAYSEHFHLADPNRDAIMHHQPNSAPIVLPNFARRMYGAQYRKLFFDSSAIIDKFAVAIWVERTCFYLNLYRTLSQGRFSEEQLENLKRTAPIAVSAVANHFRSAATAQEDPFRLLEAAFSGCEPLARLTKREREVCLRIITGFTSEGISRELGVSLHSAMTYRKRAYDKLGISSQNELFALALQTLFSSLRLN